MRFLPIISVFALLAGLSGHVFAQTDYGHAVALPGQSGPEYTTSTTGLGTTSKTASGAAPSASPEESNTYEEDDSLYRGKTSEMGTTLLRDDGPLHFKKRPREKVQQVDSLKNLQTGAVDPKFEGSLLQNSVGSIRDVAQKSDAQQSASDPNPRFKARELTFKRDANDDSQKPQAGSSPSPTPSAVESPRKKDSKANQ